MHNTFQFKTTTDPLVSEITALWPFSNPRSLLFGTFAKPISCLKICRYYYWEIEQSFNFISATKGRHFSELSNSCNFLYKIKRISKGCF